jgi:hypothetical protein|tara:strand:- start:3671 stop:3880 length:210 start_codon:yes stop_codon:yes gene_type:complete
VDSVLLLVLVLGLGGTVLYLLLMIEDTRESDLTWKIEKATQDLQVIKGEPDDKKARQAMVDILNDEGMK